MALCFASIAGQSMGQSALTIVHTNDLHAHIEPTMIRGKAYGGYARQATLIQQFRKADPNLILLNAGDTFQGTLYFNVYEGLADLAFMNAVGYHAMAVGNHEFDRGPKTFLEFAKNATFPILAANLDLTGEPELDTHIAPYTIITTADGKQIGIVGAVTADLLDISSPGPNVKLLDLETSIQKAVDELTAKRIYRVVLLSHCGFDVEQRLAAKIRGIDVVVGGHSHSLLGEKSTLEGWPAPVGTYPTTVKNPTGSDCLVLQAWEWGKAIGHIEVQFNAMGRVTGYAKATVTPITQDIPEDLRVKSMLSAFAKPIDQLKGRKVGATSTAISRPIMGDIIADAMLGATQRNNTVLAMMNPGGVRSEIEAGEITYGEAISVQPFNNTLVVIDVTGAELVAALEQMINRQEGKGLPMHISAGSSYRFDRTAPAGQRIKDLIIQGLPASMTQKYRVVVNSFLAGGGDGIMALKDAKDYRYDTGDIDLDALIEYLKKHDPIVPPMGNRVTGN